MKHNLSETGMTMRGLRWHDKWGLAMLLVGFLNSNLIFAQARPSVTIDPTVVQNMGVRVAPVVRGTISRDVRALGVVKVAEDKISTINLRFSGWVKKIVVDQTGQFVKKNAPLFEAYSPDLIAAQEDYLLAISRKTKSVFLTKSARDRLVYFGLSKSDIKRIEQKKTALETITIHAPQEGYVLHKNIVKGSRVKAGQDLYKIGSLSSVWVNTEVYDFDAPSLKLGAPATIELSFERGKQHQAKVAYIYPTLNLKTRTVTVRLELENKNLSLKPGMFATVRIRGVEKKNILKIPSEAIINSGDSQMVFVAKHKGHYEPRNIVTGMTGSDRMTEVKEGLKQGEEIVVSGQFLLDSESQLQEAVQKMLPQKASQSENYWTCGMHPQIVQDKPGQCPICGMDLVERKVEETK